MQIVKTINTKKIFISTPIRKNNLYKFTEEWLLGQRKKRCVLTVDRHRKDAQRKEKLLH